VETLSDKELTPEIRDLLFYCVVAVPVDGEYTIATDTRGLNANL
jgi:hypothetical protein